MNFAISDGEFKLTNKLSYDKFERLLLNKIMKIGIVCDYYIVDFGYNNNECTEVFYIDTNDYKICWLNDWYEGGVIDCLFGFTDSKTVGEFVKHYLWANRYKGDFEHESNHS